MVKHVAKHEATGFLRDYSLSEVSVLHRLDYWLIWVYWLDGWKLTGVCLVVRDRLFY